MAARDDGTTGREALDSVAATAARLVRDNAETSASGLENIDIISKTPPSGESDFNFRVNPRLGPWPSRTKGQVFRYGPGVLQPYQRTGHRQNTARPCGGASLRERSMNLENHFLRECRRRSVRLVL